MVHQAELPRIATTATPPTAPHGAVVAPEGLVAATGTSVVAGSADSVGVVVGRSVEVTAAEDTDGDAEPPGPAVADVDGAVELEVLVDAVAAVVVVAAIAPVVAWLWDGVGAGAVVCVGAGVGVGFAPLTMGAHSVAGKALMAQISPEVLVRMSSPATAIAAAAVEPAGTLTQAARTLLVSGGVSPGGQSLEEP